MTWLCLSASLLACGADPALPGPGGDPADPNRVANPAVPAAREYWHILESGDAYAMIPRPDGSAATVRECRMRGPLAATLEANRLCSPAASSADVDRINRMTLADALAISTFLHASLDFTAVWTGTTFGVEPFAYPEHVRLACAASAEARAGVLLHVCDWELGPAPNGVRVPEVYVYSGAEARALANLLDAIFEVKKAPQGTPVRIAVTHGGGLPPTSSRSLAYAVDVATGEVTLHAEHSCSPATDHRVALDEARARTLADQLALAQRRAHVGCTADYGDAEIVVAYEGGSEGRTFVEPSGSLCNKDGWDMIPLDVFDRATRALDEALLRKPAFVALLRQRGSR